MLPDPCSPRRRPTVNSIFLANTILAPTSFPLRGFLSNPLSFLEVFPKLSLAPQALNRCVQPPTKRDRSVPPSPSFTHARFLINEHVLLSIRYVPGSFFLYPRPSSWQTDGNIISFYQGVQGNDYITDSHLSSKERFYFSKERFFFLSKYSCFITPGLEAADWTGLFLSGARIDDTESLAVMHLPRGRVEMRFRV